LPVCYGPEDQLRFAARDALLHTERDRISDRIEDLMRVFSMLLLLCMSLFAAVACGDEVEADDGTALLIANGGGSVDNLAFTPVFGVVTVFSVGVVNVVLGSGPVTCQSVASSAIPADGVYVQVQLPDAKLGASEHTVQFSIIDDGEVQRGGPDTSGSVALTSISQSSIALSIDYVATLENKSYRLQGDFEALRCP
jgi:hypothetical protein